MGAGAGYDVTIKGIELDTKNYKVISDEIFNEEYNEHVAFVEVPVKPCIAEEWSAESYYDSIGSDWEYYDSNEDSKIDGGKAELKIYWVEHEEGRYIDNNEFENVNEAVEWALPDSIDIKVLVGAGWIHSNLPVESVHFEDDYHYDSIDEYNDGYGYETMSVDLICPNICQNINAFFEHPEEYYDDYVSENDDEIVNSHKPIKSSFVGVDEEMIADQIEEYFNNSNYDVIVSPVNKVLFQIGFNDVYVDWDIDKFYKDITNITHRFANEVLAIKSVHFECINKNGPLWLLIEVEEPM